MSEGGSISRVCTMTVKDEKFEVMIVSSDDDVEIQLPEPISFQRDELLTAIGVGA